MTIAYASGQIVLTNGSAVVTGIDTAWQISLINGGVIYPEAEGNPLPIASVDSDIAITTATKWQGVSGIYDYALVRDTSYGAQQVANANTLAQLVKEFAAGTIFKFNASGTLAGRSLFDTTPQSFSYLVSIDVEEPQLYVKASATPGDWSGPFAYGTGPVGPPPTLHFSPVVSEASGTPASIDVAGDGPYGLTFHIPRGADGDMEPVGDWALGNNYSAKQVVGHAGSSYVCKIDHTASAANEPGVGASWQTDWNLFVSKGAKGDQGAPGPMDPAIYDPQNKHADAFARSNHTGTQDLSTIMGLQSALRGYISPGANLANNSADPVNDIDFPNCVVASDESNIILMTHAAGTAQLDAAFGVGNGGRFDSAISDGWWHCFIISDGTNVKRGFSKLLNPTTAPAYPSGYTHYRRVGSIFRVSGAIKAFSQRGDVVLYSTVVSDLAAVAVGTTAQLPILTVPTGISVTALFNASMLSNTLGTLVLISSPFQAAVGANATAGNFSLYVPVNNVAGVGTFAILTNPSGQVLVVSSATAATCTVNIATRGYIDTRGRT